jgi:protein SCO1/2
MRIPTPLAALAVLAAAAAAGFAAAWWNYAAAPPSAPTRSLLMQDLVVTVYANPRAPLAFRLTDHRGRDFGPQRLRGRWSLLFFGYTHCPDVCPSTLATLAGVMDRLEPLFAADGGLQVLFVSVDPARDSAESLGTYVSFFDPDFTGATGSPDQIEALLADLGGGYRLSPAQPDGAYDVEHTAAVFIVDPRGRVFGYLNNPLNADGVVSRLQLVKEIYARAEKTAQH